MLVQPSPSHVMVVGGPLDTLVMEDVEIFAIDVEAINSGGVVCLEAMSSLRTKGSSVRRVEMLGSGAQCLASNC